MRKTFLIALVALGLTVGVAAEAATGSIGQLVFTSAPQIVAAGASSAKITFQTRSAGNSIETVDELTDFNLTSSSGAGEFAEANLSTDECSGALSWGITQIKMAAGTHSRSFCYRSAAPGQHTLGVSAPGQTWTAGEQTITITSAGAPGSMISNLTAGAVDRSSAIIEWQRNRFSKSRVWFAPAEAALDTVLASTDEVLGSRIALTGLAPDTTYQYFVVSRDRQGGTATSSTQFFTTLAL